MKKYFFIGLLTLSFFGLCIHSANATSDSLQKEHGHLMAKANAFFSANKSEIETRMKKTDRLAIAGTKDTSGAKSLIKLYLSDSAFYQTVVRHGDSLIYVLRAHDKLVNETMQKGNLSDKFLTENEEKIYKVKWVITYAKDTAKQVEKRLKITNKELKKMRDDIATQKKKEQKK
ncbi:MAG: hypothetical protein AABZ32_07360 [Bacteroidota bacterium]